jgi:rfaE bifunctional protein nucleotidyltransferase chain/domain
MKSISDKIKTREALASIVSRHKEDGLRIGFTSGAFDILHAGHVEFLEKARAECDVLIVGLNSDASVKRYKGENRPIVPEKYRARVIAALASVDYVFTFEERRNEQNIRILKPDIYFKASDYSPEQLTSKSVIESIGGEVHLIPIDTVTSTTSIIGKMSIASSDDTRYAEEMPDVGHYQRKPSKMRPAIFLDRDGTINREVGYLWDPDKFEFLPNALEGMKRMIDMGYRLVVVTNQGGIDLGYFSRDDFYKVTGRMLRGMHDAGVLIDKVLFCPHNIAEPCDCRKPATGMISRAERDLNIDMNHSYFIGDRKSDIEAGDNAGLKTMLVANPDNPDWKAWETQPDHIIRDLIEAADIILKEERTVG